MARRPGRIALVAALACALTGAGFARFAVDAGPDLLVGQSSDAKQVYDRFAANFGADPIVIVMTAQNPTALYLERNLLRVSAL
jgi:predicted RND superfamily exporter protein